MSRGSAGWKSRARRFADLLAANGNVKSDRVDIVVPESLGAEDTPTFKNLILHETDSATGCQVQFSDQTSGAQKGFIEYVHADSQSDGAGNAFKFHSTESSLNVLVDGNVKADAFYGDGSSLTNLPAGGDTVNVTETVIWSGNYYGTGNITLSQSMLNFDFVAIFGGNDHCGHDMHSATAFVNNSNQVHSLGWLFCSYDRTHMWYKAMSETSIRVSRGNSHCKFVVGYNLT